MRIGLWLLSFAFLGIVADGLFIGLKTPAATSFEKLHKSYQASDVLILDRNGLPLDVVRVNDQHRSLAWTEWDQVSPIFQNLLVRVEDKRFYRHHGVDEIAILHSVWQSALGRKPRGASTITMQLAGLMHPTKRHESFFKSLTHKFQQIILARKIEKSWSKKEILEAYVNKISFRGELVGIGAASFGYFNKSPVALDEQESATLIALIRAPNASGKRVAARVCQILSESKCTELEAKVNAVLKEDYHISRNMDYLPVSSKYIFENANLPDEPTNLKTTLDLRIQELALQTLREQLNELKGKNVNEGAIVVLDTKTGKALAYVGNPGPRLTAYPRVDGVQAKRQVGSTIKAFVYATAFDLNLLNLNSLLEDSKADIAIEGGRVYHPKNYDRVFRGYVGAGEALASSLNVPAVRTLALVGERRVIDNLKKLGFTSLQDEEFYGPSLALGSLDASLWEMTQGYRQISQSKIFSQNTSDQIFQALALPEYRRLTFGIDNVLTLPFLAAVKTGTSKDMRDNWCIGWTPDYTVGVWVGNFSGQSMWNVSGVTGAAPIWRKLMLALHPNPPQQQALHYEEPKQAIVHRSITRIRYPVEDMHVGLDPDIPKRFQKMPIEIENPQKGQRLFLNDVALGASRDTLLWSLKKGRQRLALKSASGEIIDQVRFEVR